jgi:hypothetical protein
MREELEASSGDSGPHPLNELSIAVLLNGTSFMGLEIKCRACGKQSLQRETLIETARLEL